ncbi:MAG TPA: methyltransferase domain-containing protein [Gemmatimonadales bacterium]|nr:methyltransferase domain-containing protein [Gemmatimonadales bacterium]
MSALAGSPIGEDLLDRPDADPAAVRLSLQNIARANALFGGWSAVRWGLRRLLEGRASATLTLLDIGTGAGDLPRRAERWARRRGVRLECFGLERNPTAASLAAETSMLTILGCGSAIPLRDGGVDIVTLSQVAHHLAPDALATVAREMTRVARIGVVLADLRPAAWAGPGYRVAGALLGFDRYTVEDGITSLRRGYSRESLAQQLAVAGITPRIAVRLAPRIIAVWRTDGGRP